MMMVDEGCCDAGGCAAADGADARADGADARADPTLMSCCEREEADRRAAARLRRALLARDPSASRRREMAVVRAPPPPPPPGAPDDEEMAPGAFEDDRDDESDLDGSEMGDGEEEAALMARLREMRMAQLKAAGRAEGARAGPSRFRVEHMSELEIERRLMELVHEPERGYIVCHWAMHSGPGAEADACVVAQLEALAAAAREAAAADPAGGGRRGPPPGFTVLCAHQKHSHRPGRLLGRLGVLGVPALVAFRDGVVVGKACGYAQFGGLEDLREERITRWLGAIGALPRALGALTRGAGAGDEDEDEDEDGDGDGRPCPECGRTYPHEHVRAVYSSAALPGGGDSDDEGSDFD